MRRLAMLVVLGATFGLAATPAAQASFHLAKVSEVLTSNGGDATRQFIEVQDPAEPFPAEDGPYELAVYSPAGVLIAKQPLAAATLESAAARRPMLISTPAFDAAAGTTGDFALTTALPTAAAQACFLAAGSRVHCMSWGTIADPLSGSGGRTAGGAPTDGQSLQTQCNDTALLATPTPAAANAQVAPSCSNRAPVAAFTFSPSEPTDGQEIAFDGGASSDPDAGDKIASWQWSFDGVGVTTTVPTVRRSLAAGEHVVTLRVIDSQGRASAEVTRTVRVFTNSGGPAVALLRIGSRWRLGSRLPVYAARRAPTGTTISFGLSAPATVRLEFLRSTTGRSVGGRCVAPTRANRSMRKCARQVLAGSLSHRFQGGSNELRFQGRLSRNRALVPGRYTLRVFATDGAGRRSAPRTATFTVLPAR